MIIFIQVLMIVLIQVLMIVLIQVLMIVLIQVLMIVLIQVLIIFINLYRLTFQIHFLDFIFSRVFLEESFVEGAFFLHSTTLHPGTIPRHMPPSKPLMKKLCAP